MRNNAFFFIIISFLFSFTPAQAIDIPNPHLIEQLNFDFNQYGAVGITKGDITFLAINISTFQNSENQKADFSGEYSFAPDEFKNERIRLVQKSGDLQFKYSIIGSAEISGKHTYTIPASYSTAGINSAYLLPTKNIQSDNSRITELARNLTRGASTDFDKAARIAIWVHSNVNYTLDLDDVAKDAVWVLDNKIGTCDEFSTLFIAMARSVGIPAKYVSGWVYGSIGWQKHAWAEVYVGKWVPVDATWLEVGNLDAIHIKFMETADNYVANQATALGTGLGTIEWSSDNVSFSVKNMRESEVISSQIFSSIIPKNQENILGLGKSAIIGLKLLPKEYLVDEFTIAPCKGMDIVRIENKQRNAILVPGKAAAVFWKITTNADLGTSSVYTCPIVINSRYFGKQIFELTVDPRVKESLDISMSLNKYIASTNENLAAAVTVKNANRKGLISIGIVSESGFAKDEFNLDDSFENAAEFRFFSGGVGKHTIYAYSDRGDVVEESYEVYDAGDVFIEKINAPEYILLGEMSYAEIYLKNNKQSEASAKFSVKLNGVAALDETITIPAQSMHLMNLTIPSDRKGMLKLAFRLVSDSIEEKVADVRIYNITTLLLE
ncbi:MAG: transglutaminase-like domain-containing protein, partial [Nanoarchaeota archaeon]|nr:transglutaminase-like domain-containing protein [Nanoarchaeota archaeon]